MQAKTPRQQAIAFIAAYDGPEPDAYDKAMVRVARKWLRILTSTHTTQGTVNKLLEEFTGPTPDGYGGAWTDLRQRILDWAMAEEWVE